jgi:hypothetical protein
VLLLDYMLDRGVSVGPLLTEDCFMAQANRSIEVGTGLFVLLGFAALGFLTTQLPGSGLHLKRGIGDLRCDGKIR